MDKSSSNNRRSTSKYPSYSAKFRALWHLSKTLHIERSKPEYVAGIEKPNSDFLNDIHTNVRQLRQNYELHYMLIKTGYLHSDQVSVHLLNDSPLNEAAQ